MDGAFPIDAVFTWVDGADPAWLERRHAALIQTEESGQPLHDGALAPCRFQNNDELRYSLRSLERFAPWIRRVHLVTDRQSPVWLREDRVHLVDHSEIFPPDNACPVFNSNAIETVLHRIPGLAPHFLSFNDDFMLGRAVRPEMFFTPDGKPLIWVKKRCPAPFFTDAELARCGPYTATIHRSQRLAGERYRHPVPYRLNHYPKAMTMAGFESLWADFPEDMRRTMLSRFRAATDVSVHTLFACAQLATGAGVERAVNGISGLVWALRHGPSHLGATLGDDNYTAKCRLIRLLHPLTFCLNDGDKTTDAHRQHMMALYDRLFPHKSRFEK